MVIAIGRIRRNEDLIGLRIFDTETKKAKDIRIEDIDKVKIKNIKHLSELGIVDNKHEDKPIVILGEKDGKYLTVDINGKAGVLTSLKGYIYSDLLSNIDGYKKYIKNNKEEQVFEFEVDEDTDEVLLKKYIPNNEKFRIIEIPSFVTGIAVDYSIDGYDADMGIQMGPFYNVTQSLKIINRDNKIKKMDYMFAGFQGKELDLSEFYTQGTTCMMEMFHACHNIGKLDLSKFDTSEVTNMQWMLCGTNISKIDLSNFDTSKVTDMSFMFADFKGTRLDLSNFDTSNLAVADCMFYNCRNLKELDLSNFDTSSLRQAGDMFTGTTLTPQSTNLHYKSNK